MNAKISYSSVDATTNPVDWMYSLEDAGFQGWEIVAEGLQKVDGEFKERVREIYETTNLVLSLHTPLSDVNIASVNERIWAESVRQVKESIEDTHEFIDNICVVHPGLFSPLSIQMPDKAVQKAIAGLRAICETASEYGLRIAVENLISINMLMGRTPDELVRIVRGVDMDNLGICLDVAHANTTKTLDEFFRSNDVDIIHMHVSDNFGTDDLHLPVGDGNLDWKKVLNGANDYEGLVVIEVYTVEAGIKSMEYLRNLTS